MKAVITKAEFVGSFSSCREMPQHQKHEIAVLGRSNVGKSTFINRITNKKGLARTSSTPGRTQALVVFELTLSISSARPKQIYLVDLPGFGYAKLSKTERDRLHLLIEDYIHSSRQLRLVSLLNDCRRPPQEEELLIQNMTAEEGRHLLVVANKIDKLSGNQKTRQLSQIAQAYGLEQEDLVVSGEGLSGQDFWRRALPLL